MRLGVLLPTFETSAAPAFAVSDAVAAAGLDGLFAYDHLWPMGSPTRPALAPFPLLAAVAARQPGLWVGPLVARVGLFGTRHMIDVLSTLGAVAPGRVIAALGTGDHLSADENEAYGLANRNANERRAMLRDVAATLIGDVEVWIGAGAPDTNALAREVGATLNLWNKPADEVAAAAREGTVSWAGPLREDVPATLDRLAEAGATWAVAAPDADLEVLATWRRENPLTTFS